MVGAKALNRWPPWPDALELAVGTRPAGCGGCGLHVVARNLCPFVGGLQGATHSVQSTSDSSAGATNPFCPGCPGSPGSCDSFVTERQRCT